MRIPNLLQQTTNLVWPCPGVIAVDAREPDMRMNYLLDCLELGLFYPDCHRVGFYLLNCHRTHPISLALNNSKLSDFFLSKTFKSHKPHKLFIAILRSETQKYAIAPQAAHRDIEVARQLI